MEPIITILTVLSMYLSAAQNVGGEYYYNAEINDGIVSAIYVYDQTDEGLTPKLVCHYDYDSRGRLIEKEVSSWNSWKREYQPTYRLQMSYTSDGYELAHSVWSNKRQQWTESGEKMMYRIDNGQVLSVSYLQKNNNGDYSINSHMKVVDPYQELLLTIGK